ncbi:non-ribosomal peptide synthetase [Chryseobacterium aureum]|uniref:non-ribosomal peptide synthetase n=1 Tax=Chryseobacterium aureum TaxID=2497456 RepID=UPI000F892B5B|nr:non-ribosomal peptide synthetase [Chryseobacterium aureum]
MNKALNIIKKAHDKGIKLELEDGALVLNSEHEDIDDALLVEIKLNKELIIEHFSKFDITEPAYKSVDQEVIKPFDRKLIKKIPLSFGQERLWFLDRLQGSVEYHIPFALRLSGDLDREALFLSLKEIVNRHEVLRTVIHSDEGVGYQEVLAADDWGLSYQDIAADVSVLPGDLQAFLSAPFDLSRDYMFRSCLYDLGGNEYVLAGVFHHISSDGWSQGILIGEFVELYHSYVSGKESGLMPLSLQYVDYALWQRNNLEGAVLDRQLSYWEDQLKDVKVLELPTDYRRPALQSFSGASLSFELDGSLSAGISSLSREEGVTVFMTLLGAFKVLLSRYSGQEDICVGTPVANRTRKELEGMIGFFVNTLALRSQVAGEKSFRDFLQDIRHTTLEAYDHQQVPFEKVVERVARTRDMSVTPLFQVMFVLQNTPDSVEIELDGLSLRNYESQEQQTSKFDLTITIEESTSGFSVNMNYCKDLFREETIRSMFIHYQELLQSIVASPATLVGELSLLTVEEKHQLLEAFNDTATDYPKDKTVIDLFEEQAATTPDATAAVYEGRSLTYRELDERSNQLARILIAKGVSAEDLVGISMNRSVEMIIGILGILKSGGAYVPIDPDYPQARKEYMLEDSGIKLLLSDNGFAYDRNPVDVLVLTDDWSGFDDISGDKIERAASPSNLAYVIYTSGSTGKPKGVMNSHKGMLNRLLWAQDTYELTPEDTVLQKTSFSFDVSVWELIWPLMSGAKLVFARQGAQGDAAYLIDLIEEQQITTLHFVPSMLSVFLTGVSIGNCSSLRRVLCSGEALTLEQVRSFRALFPKVRFDNLYGPTEAAIDVSSWSVPEVVTSLEKVPIGRPVANTSLYILDKNNGLLPVGVVGELCIGGCQVAEGYLHQESLTNEKFVPNPFKEGEKMYRTGDLARWMPDGNIEYLGRKDDQVKIRGYRIELGEIEDVLSGLPGVTQSCVLAKTDEHGDKRLVAYVVVTGELDKEVLQSQLQESLPEHMVPRLWMKLDEMPLNSNGKLDRKALPEIDSSALSTKTYVAPTTEIEESLAEIWQELLGIEKVGIHDNFFELGGHSLLSIRLIAKIRKLGYMVSIGDFYTDPTIAQLSTKLTSIEEEYKVPENVIIIGSEYITPSMVTLVDLNQEELDLIMNHVPGGASNIQDIYPLSPLQEGIYFHHLMSDRNTGDPYVLPVLLSFPSLDKRSAFIEALRFVINRHDVLRTCVLNDGFSQTVQVVLREVELNVEELSIDEKQDILSQVEQEQTAGNLYMDLTHAPAVRVKVADDGANEKYYLILDHHHMMMDHIGNSKVIEEIGLYLSGKADLLPAPALYRDFIGHTLNKKKQKESKEYFTERFGKIESPTYPFHLVDTNMGGSTTIISSKAMLSPELRDGIRKLSADQQISPAVVFHAAFGLVLGRCSGTEYALFGSVLLGRLQGAKGSESSLGLFMNTLPLLLELKGDIPSYIAQTNKHLQTLLDHEQTSLSSVHDWSGIPNDVPMFSALLNYRHSGLGHLEEIPGFDGELLSSFTRDNYPFSLDVDDYSNDFGLTFNISSVGIDPSAMIFYMEEALKVLLTNMDKHSQITVKELSILPESEFYQLSEVFSNSSVDCPADTTFVDLFERQAAATPDAVAVVCQGESLSYRELDEKSNQLAHYLIDKGVLVEDLVGICMSRSLEMIVGIVGILKSGAAYVPVDPDFPQSRIDYMLEDSGVKLLLSDTVNRGIFSSRDSLEVIELDTAWQDTFGKASIIPLSRRASPDNLVYVIYTSGSTGMPKGVLVTHGSLTDYLYGLLSKTNIGSCHSFGSTSSIATDLGNTVLYPSLLSGGMLYVLTEDELIDAEAIRSLELDCLKMVPSHWKALRSHESIVVPGKCLILGGEAFTGDIFDLLSSHGVSCEVYNHYGPTETTIGKLIHKVDLGAELSRPIPLGVPFGNTSVYILDGEGRLCPLGSSGELCIGGLGVARGYLNNDALTLEKFINSPFKSGDRLYKTGDLAKWLSDGTIEFLGRKDNQVKVNGYRIELGEIENALSGLPGVNQSCVLCREDGHGDQRLVGYVVMEGALDKELLQSQLQESLPEYMVPRLWVELSEMPLTLNGKLDRKALPDVDTSALSTSSYAAPRTEIEASLAGIWEELLGVEKVGIYDNFFELGGQSLLSIRLIARIRKLGYTVNISEFYTEPTIAHLSTKLRSSEQGYKVPENRIVEGSEHITPSMVTLVDLSQKELDMIMNHVPGGGANIQDIYPLSPLQEGIYFHHLMSDSSQGDPYVLSQLLSFSSLEKRVKFIEALRFVIKRHDVLRTCVLSEGISQTVQVVLREVELKVEELIIDEGKDVLSELKQQQASDQLYMNLRQAPAVRVKVADDADHGAYYLLLNHHHMMMDHVGTSKIIKEISLYLSGQGGLLSTPALYRDFIGHTLNKDKLNAGKTYFSGLFENIETPTYPFNLVNTKIDGSTTVASSKMVLSAELRDGIRKLSADLQISPAVLFHAAFGLVLGRCSGTDYALFGSVLLGRLQGAQGSDSSLGLFMNTLPVLLDLKGDIPSYISQTNKHLQTLLDYEQTPLSSVHHWSGIPNDVPMFSALLNYRHSEAGYLDTIPGFDGELLSGQYRTNYPFYLDVDDYSHDFSLTFNMSPIGIDPSVVVEYMEEALKVLLTHMNKPSSPATVEELSILTKEDIHQLTEVFNDTAVDYPKDKTVVDLFELQAAKSPNAIAVVFDNESLTYRELDERSNQLANYLMDKGVSVEDLVGICMNRSLEMITGILGILKSGAAYVPIDPDFPQSRKEYMLEDSGVKILLSDSMIPFSDEQKKDLNVIVLNKNWDLFDQVSRDRIARIASPSHLAYVIYTSGSTGKPKGVQVEHKSIVSLSMTCDYIRLTDQTVWLSTGSISFDATTIEYWGTLLNGGKLVLTTTDSLLKMSHLKALILENKVTALWMTASWFHQVVEEDISVFQPLKYLLVGGDTVLYTYTNKVKELYPELTIVNGYGPTENTTFSTSYTIGLTDHPLPIGKPIKDSYAYILDQHMNLAPVGVVGELVVGGSGVARGYLNNEELTHEKFIKNPFKAGDRLYRTGDLAKWLPDGNIEFIGRKDDQVKIRGYRIELGEVENVLAGLSGVVQSCVLAKADEQGNKRLIAYVVMEGALDKESFQSQLQEILPEYMVPRLWVELEAMPLTSNGKLDRKALPDIDSSALSAKTYVAPGTETEQRLAVIWQELLGVEKVGIRDNFFELGGHSLLAVKLINTIQKEFEMEISIQDVFEYNCIEQLGNYIQYLTLEVEDGDFDDEIYI